VNSNLKTGVFLAVLACVVLLLWQVVKQGGAGAKCVRRRFRHNQMRHMHGVERAPEQRVHCAQEGVEGVEGVAVESAAAGQVRFSCVAFG